MQETIFSTIRKEADDFYNGHISVVPGYSFNQYYTIKLAHLYLNSKYEDSSQYLGRDKLFFNVVVPPCEVATKMLNLDTKNIKLLSQNAKCYFSTYLLEKELKLWLKRSKFAGILNTLAEEAPRYGSVVLEKVKGGAEVVDLRKLINDPTVDRIKDSRFVTTIHYMTPGQLRETNWDNVEEAITLFSNKDTPPAFEDRMGDLNYLESTPYVKVFKRYGEVPQNWIDGGKSEKSVKALFIVAGIDFLDVSAEGKVIGEKGLVLFSSRWYKDWPFKDFHYTKVKGRWLGLGIPEMLSDVQIRINELKNQKRVSMELSSMHLLQTKDKQIVRNVLTDLQSGDVLTSQNGIEPIAIEERNLPAFQDEEMSYLQQADKLSFAYEAIRGETPAATTPLGTVQIAVAQSTSVYGFKRENLAIMYQDFFNDLVLNELLNDLTAEHILRFVGTAEELAQLDMMASELHANDVVKQMLLDGKVATPEIVQAEKDKAIQEYRKLGEARFIKIKKGLYNDVEFEFDFNVANESVDPQTVSQNTQLLFTTLAQNPAILQDPRVKMMYFKWAESLGVNPAELEMADAQAQRSQLQAQTQSNGPIQSGGQQPSPVSGGGQQATPVPAFAPGGGR